jgi:hypothetical protein
MVTGPASVGADTVCIYIAFALYVHMNVCMNGARIHLHMNAQQMHELDKRRIIYVSGHIHDPYGRKPLRPCAQKAFVDVRRLSIFTASVYNDKRNASKRNFISFHVEEHRLLKQIARS